MTAPLSTPSAQRSDDPHDQLVADYEARAAQHARAHGVAARAAAWTSRARLLVFLAAVIGIAIGSRIPGAGAAQWAIGVVAIAVFLPLVRRHRRLTALARQHDALRQSCELGPARIHRRWASLSPPLVMEIPKTHPFAADLHLTGDTSLTRLLGTVSAGPGREVLANWLLAESPPSIDALRAHQSGILELRPLADWRERLGVYAAGAGRAKALEHFLIWAEDAAWLHPRRVLVWTARVLALLTLVAAFGALAQLIPVGVVIVLVLANHVLIASLRGRLTATLDQASGRGFNGRSYGTMFEHAQAAAFQSTSLRELQRRMGDGRTAAAFGRLAQIATSADLRFSPMSHFIMQSLVLWDVHVVDELERWRLEHGHALRDRLRALGELEAHAALATLAYDNPTWCVPAFRDDDERVIATKALAHPLLPPDTRIANDVDIGPPGTFLLVTGSNMAGKSTLLRSIALNVVLAQAGTTVCAAEFLLPRVRLRTSIHVQDELESGLSLFMVELLRLKTMVDAAREPADAALLYVADEMLRGTNMQERRPAVAAVLLHLLRAGAIGAIATHDLELAAETDLATHARAVHLIERFKDTPTGPAMWFDYRLRPGVATSGNALKLLELVGLEVGRPEHGSQLS